MKRWFGSYTVTSANDNGIYHLTKLDETRIAVLVAEKRIKVFKKQHGGEPDPMSMGDSDDDVRIKEDKGSKSDG